MVQHPSFVLPVVAILVFIVLQHSHITVVSSASVVPCVSEDDPEFKFKIKVKKNKTKKKKCSWVAKNPSKWCEKTDKNGIEVENLCPVACGNQDLICNDEGEDDSDANIDNNENFAWTAGKATYYVGTEDSGACGYNDLPKMSFPYGFQVATGGDTFNEGYGCGACFEVSCEGSYSDTNPDCDCDTSKTVVVQATDLCPGCGADHFDLNRDAFNVIAGSSQMAETCGVIKTKYRRVNCDFRNNNPAASSSTTGNIELRSKSGTSGYWYGLHVDDVAGFGAISGLALRESGRRENGQTDFDIICNKSGGASYWLCNLPRKIAAPLDVSLTDLAQRTLERNDIITDLNGDLTFSFGTNFGAI